MKLKVNKLFLSFGISAIAAMNLAALEFGGMGNVSAGMGGAGVALKNSQWAIYYNPALLAFNKKSGFAYSVGVNIHETNFSKLATIDLDNMQSMPDKFSGLFTTTFTARPIAANGKSIGTLGGVFGDVFKDLLGTTSDPTDDDLKKYLENTAQQNGLTITGKTSPEEVLEEIKNKPEVFDSIKKDLEDSIDKVAQQNPDNSALGILGDIVSGLNKDNISGLLNSVAGGKTDFNDILKGMGGVTLKVGNDPSLAKFIEDINSINDILNRNDVSVNTQNGIVLNVGSKGKRGTLSLAVMPSAFFSAMATLDPTHNKIIIDYGGGNYIEAEVGSGNVTIKPRDQNGFNNSSIMSDNAKHTARVNSLSLVEVPVGYGHLIETKVGNFGIGGALKYMGGVAYNFEHSGGINTIGKGITAPSLQEVAENFTHTWGLDIGGIYQPRAFEGLLVGLVAKNLNAPKIKGNNATQMSINPQVRAGVSTSFLNDRVSLAFDLDLLPNETLSKARPYSQVAGGGIMLDLKMVDLRLGAMYDFRSIGNEGMIVTAGLNILGFLDVALQSNINLVDASSLGLSSNIRIPSYLSVKVGGGFSW